MLCRERYEIGRVVRFRRPLVRSGLETPVVPPKVLGTIFFGDPVRRIFEDFKTQNPVPRNPQIPI